MNSEEIKSAIKSLRNTLYPADRSHTGPVSRSDFLDLIKKIDDFLKAIESNL
ncbi:MAG: hypothetical protein IKO76_06580 [Butyrivibrio sp.]|nr:hypothetical protein [Butyrivibrio sp.]